MDLNPHFPPFFIGGNQSIDLFNLPLLGCKFLESLVYEFFPSVYFVQWAARQNLLFVKYLSLGPLAEP